MLAGLAVALAILPGLSSPAAAVPGGAARREILAQLARRHERSVVAVARFRPRRQVQVITGFDRLRALHPISQRREIGPKNPGFIPHEFATGVVVDSAGLILVNYHVLAEESQYVVWVAGGSPGDKARAYHARVKAADPRSDLAVLEIADEQKPQGLRPVRFGDADAVWGGHSLVALGGPPRIVREGKLDTVSGIVSGLRCRAAPVPGESHPRISKPTLHHYGTLIKTDAKLHPCTSGGALLNLRGELVGLATSQGPADGDAKSAYAIPVDDVFRRVVETLKQGREVEYGLLGVVPRDLTPRDKRRVPKGALIQTVQRGSPAWHARILEGDVVTAVNGEPIDGEEGLMLHIGRLPVEAEVQLDIVRGGQKLKRQAVLTKYPVYGKQVFAPPLAWRGMRVDYASVRKPGPFGYRFGPELYDGCVWVREVAQDSPAWECGLRPGMFITHVEDQRVKTPTEFRAAIAGRQQTVNLRVGGLRGGEDPVRSVKPKTG